MSDLGTFNLSTLKPGNNGEVSMGGHIIPTADDVFDIGSAERKVRDLYVSDNSIWIGDKTKISFTGGKMKFRKRKTNVVPAAILAQAQQAGHNSAAATQAALQLAGVSTLQDMKLQDWHKYMRTLKSDAKMTDIFRDNDDDYEESSASDAWKEIGSSSIYTTTNVGIGSSSPMEKLEVRNGNIAIVNNSWKSAGDDDQLAGKINFHLGGSAGELSTPVASIEGYDKYQSGGYYSGAMALKVHGDEKLRIDQDLTTIRTNVKFNWADDRYLMMDHSSSYRQGFEFDAASRALRLFSTGADNDGGCIIFQTRDWTSPNQDDYGSERMRISTSGSVGIGTSTPDAKFHVSGTAGGIHQSWLLRVGLNHGRARENLYNYERMFYKAVEHQGAMSILASGDICTQATFVCHSDERLKKDVVEVEDGSSLEILRLLKPKRYKYIDAAQGIEPVWGFMAQEVAEVIPYATKKRTECIPNIYEVAKVSSYDPKVIKFTKFETTNLVNDSILKVIDTKDDEHLIQVVDIIDKHTIKVKEDVSSWTGALDSDGNVIAGKDLFVYGTQVDDVHTLNKNAIWTVATSALQEVDRLLQKETEKLKTLETESSAKLIDLERRLGDERRKNKELEDRVSAHEDRLKLLESAVWSKLLVD